MFKHANIVQGYVEHDSEKVFSFLSTKLTCNNKNVGIIIIIIWFFEEENKKRKEINERTGIISNIEFLFCSEKKERKKNVCCEYRYCFIVCACGNETHRRRQLLSKSKRNYIFNRHNSTHTHTRDINTKNVEWTRKRTTDKHIDNQTTIVEW